MDVDDLKVIHATLRFKYDILNLPSAMHLLYTYVTDNTEIEMLVERNQTKEHDIDAWRARRLKERELLFEDGSNETVVDIIEHQKHLKLNYENALKDIDEMYCNLTTALELHCETCDIDFKCDYSNLFSIMSPRLHVRWWFNRYFDMEILDQMQKYEEEQTDNHFKKIMGWLKIDRENAEKDPNTKLIAGHAGISWYSF